MRLSLERRASTYLAGKEQGSVLPEPSIKRPIYTYSMIHSQLLMLRLPSTYLRMPLRVTLYAKEAMLSLL
jgi:hypothetical protein